MDSWDEGDEYERYMGRWSRPIASEFIDWLDIAPGARWLDVGCGTGALSSEIKDRSEPAAMAGIDPSAGFIATARDRLGTDVDLRVGDAQALPFGSDGFDATVSGLALNFVPDPTLAAREMCRVTRPGGRVAVYLWDYRGGMEMIRRFWDAAVALDPDAETLDEARRFPLCTEDALRDLLAGAGMTSIGSTALYADAVFGDFDDFWSPFLGGQGPAPSYVAGLEEEHRGRLESELRRTLPASSSGSIRLGSRAWAVAGTA